MLTILEFWTGNGLLHLYLSVIRTVSGSFRSKVWDEVWGLD